MACYLSATDVWALSLGCIIGWGAFVMPGTTFLPLAGPAGTVISMLLSTLAMLVIGLNYAYLMKRQPGIGGVYTYTKQAFGRDHAFLSSWFLCLSYLSLIPQNATALAVMGCALFGSALERGVHYQLAGYDIYLGEVRVALRQTGREGDRADYELRVSDSGIGMSEAFAEILGQFGFMVETAENGKIAVERVEAAEPGYYDLLLMDIQMPVMDGYEATRAIRALPDAAKAAVPIVAMTANAFAEDVRAAEEAGMQGHVAKPIDITKLMETITGCSSGTRDRLRAVCPHKLVDLNGSADFLHIHTSAASHCF